MPIITSTGLVPITQAEYVKKLSDLYLSIDSDWVLDSNSPDGQFVILASRMMWELDQQAIKVANGRDPRTATGSQVDDLAELFDVQREKKRQSKVTFDLVGTAGTKVKAGSQIRNTITKTVWTLDSDVTIPAAGTFTAVDYGLVTANAPFDPLTLVTGWTAVNNKQNFIIGRDDQTDAQLESDRKAQVTKGSTSMRESVRAAILAVPNVNSCEVIENDERTTVNSQPGNSIHCIVSGGDEMEICRAIESKTSLGCKTVGSIAHKVTTADDPYGMTRRFDRPNMVDIFVRYTIKGGAKLPTDAVKRIPGYVEQYTSGDVDSPFYSNNDGFRLGQSPSSGLLQTPLNWAVGDLISMDSTIYTEKVELSKNGTDWVDGTIVISRLEQALFDKTRVSVVNS